VLEKRHPEQINLQVVHLQFPINQLFLPRDLPIRPNWYKNIFDVHNHYKVKTAESSVNYFLESSLIKHLLMVPKSEFNSGKIVLRRKN
jgi:hypothetical protein